MKILEITNLGYENGGVETGLTLLRDELIRRGHEVKILTSNSRPDLRHFSDFEFDALESKSRILQLFYRAFFPDPYFALKKIFKDFNPDVVHIHTISQMSSSVLFLLKKYRTVITTHQVEDYTLSILPWSFPQSFFTGESHRRDSLTFLGTLHYFFHTYINRNFYRLGFRNVDVFIAISRYMQNVLKKENIESVYLPNATKLFDSSPIDVRSQTILFVGRLEHSKGVQTIIEALLLIRKKFSGAKLIIAGRGTYQKQLEQTAARSGLAEHIHFLGFQNREELYELYKSATVVVMPSIWPEAFGNVGIEAMSVGRPVVASNVGGICDWLSDGETGFVFPPEDASVLAEKISALFSNPELLLRFSENARKNSLQFTIENHAEKLLAVYEKIKKP